MAKLGLIFICVFLMVQLSACNRLVRSPQPKESSDALEFIKGMMSEVMKISDPKNAMKLILAARIARDTPTPIPTPTKTEEPVVFNLNDALSQITQGIQNALSKESIDKFVENLGETGEKLKEFGQGLINKAQETASQLTKKQESQ